MSSAIGRPRRAPTRTCVACRTPRPKRELVRVVRTPDRRMALDETGRLAGRGAYLCRADLCWRVALEKSVLQRALGVPVPADLRAVLDAGPGAATTMTTMMTINEGGTRGQE